MFTGSITLNNVPSSKWRLLSTLVQCGYDSITASGLTVISWFGGPRSAYTNERSFSIGQFKCILIWTITVYFILWWFHIHDYLNMNYIICFQLRKCGNFKIYFLGNRQTNRFDKVQPLNLASWKTITPWVRYLSVWSLCRTLFKYINWSFLISKF